MAICFLFNIKNDPDWNQGTTYYYNGHINKIQAVHNSEELKYIKSTYSAVYGRAIQTYVWDGKRSPVYVRVFGVLKPKAFDEEMTKILHRLELLEERYIKAYGDPTRFIAQVRTAIKVDASKTAEVLGYAEIDKEYRMDKTITRCDYHWGRIKYNNQTAWIAIGDITGEKYGEWLID